ncbi:hypothetical protein COL24_00880 [Bacillus toyonensis]|uniref:DUF4145 domain-containing protein n=2 Tax=Bacillus toyonensis TaxID=155322 RepID=UPI000BF06375|nr:DUF4145 domain-containing protein [Bacillus toyonensis]PEO24937.1 hypothetical protein CN589_26095 [Bacillus toyonensis]PFX45598.1 hypothetical protein COL24_00880 [Bacillus toyonensis]PFX97219.1 hypothetical protein COL45_28345 [Bacillus toyonensis]PHB76831.1 hypothetical protein COE93_16815 [Bacillus toyonensis]
MSNYLFKSRDKHPTITCPHCFKISSQNWYFKIGPFHKLEESMTVHSPDGGSTMIAEPEEPEVSKKPFDEDNLAGIILSTCSECDATTYWLKSIDGDELQLYPQNFSNYPQPHEDMPKHISKTFKEAGSVMDLSLGSSAALARLTLENLLIHLGYEGYSLNDKIGKVIKDGEISKKTEKALDVIRVYGNSGAHSGIIDLEELPWVPATLLKLINLVVDDLITAPKEIDNMFDALPAGIKAGIEKRDKK